MKQIKQLFKFLIYGSEKLINNIIFSLMLGFIGGVIAFKNTDHEWEYVKKYLIPSGENVVETYSHRKVYFYDYKPAIVVFIILSALIFLYYNRSRRMNIK